MHYKISELPKKEVIKGFTGRFIHGEHFTLAFWEIEAGAELPEHSHPHEQSTQVLEGELEMTIDGKTNSYKPGMVAIIPPHSKHSGKALTRCKVTDIFSPVREDYK
ncbi:MAG: cupin domain-containing protein [Flavobacteriaceae bacterium]|nr:cupin domain-containing protein [Flavobacteriaceae bacterium]